jgi:hypothetical protein
MRAELLSRLSSGCIHSALNIFSGNRSIGQFVSHPLHHDARMINRIKHLMGPKSERVITTFGEATLVGLRDGSVELRGGKPDERTTAKEWISLFMHEAVPKFRRF